MGKEAGGPHGTVNARRPRASPAASVFLPFAKTRPPHQDCRGARLAGGGGPSRRVRGGEGLGTSSLRDRPVGRARPLGGQRAPSNPEEMKATVVAGEGAGEGQAPHAVTSVGSAPRLLLRGLSLSDKLGAEAAERRAPNPSRETARDSGSDPGNAAGRCEGARTRGCDRDGGPGTRVPAGSSSPSLLLESCLVLSSCRAFLIEGKHGEALTQRSELGTPPRSRGRPGAWP